MSYKGPQARPLVCRANTGTTENEGWTNASEEEPADSTAGAPSQGGNPERFPTAAAYVEHP